MSENCLGLIPSQRLLSVLSRVPAGPNGSGTDWGPAGPGTRARSQVRYPGGGLLYGVRQELERGLSGTRWSRTPDKNNGHMGRGWTPARFTPCPSSVSEDQDTIRRFWALGYSPVLFLGF
ncbi:hypothetical protein DPEC_G00173670 [Dallia pectoralis]|uniref:Uncharacterized protein n=1 Tax=Dallia pectoralis TaxID=75939 RepID=A0ACC2GE34_DALPE|nr:hypothetical protein DPEC_G00173670 [Dallia pectoralis]